MSSGKYYSCGESEEHPLPPTSAELDLLPHTLRRFRRRRTTLNASNKQRCDEAMNAEPLLKKCRITRLNRTGRALLGKGVM